VPALGWLGTSKACALALKPVATTQPLWPHRHCLLLPIPPAPPIPAPRLRRSCPQLETTEGAAEAPSLLRLGSELGLAQLQRAAAAYIAQHWRDAAAGEAYAALSKGEVDLVAAELAAALDKVGRAPRRGRSVLRAAGG
jgi:hypothetical protein